MVVAINQSVICFRVTCKTDTRGVHLRGGGGAKIYETGLRQRVLRQLEGLNAVGWSQQRQREELPGQQMRIGDLSVNISV